MCLNIPIEQFSFLNVLLTKAQIMFRLIQGKKQYSMPVKPFMLFQLPSEYYIGFLWRWFANIIGNIVFPCVCANTLLIFLKGK